MSYVDLDPLSAFTAIPSTWLAQLLANTEALHDGSGFASEAIPKTALAKPHYNALLFSTSGAAGGQVVTNSETVVNFDAADTDNDNGITATTGTGAYLTVTRAGIYNIDAAVSASDGAASSTFIVWLEISIDAGANWLRFRQADRRIADNEGQVYSICLPLPANARVRLSAYNDSGNIRLACPTSSATFQERILTGPKLSVTEIR